MKILVVIGTRPEVIKTVPLVLKLRTIEGMHVTLCSTGQHKEIMDQALRVFNVVPDYNLEVMKPDQSLSELTGSILIELQQLIQKIRPDLIIGQGDTSTSFSTILGGFYEKIPVVHIEAGLRTGDIYSPFPEEMTRRVTALISNINFAPTEAAKANLLSEGIPEKNIVLSGNTGVDALFYMRDQIESDLQLKRQLQQQFSYLDPKKKLIIATAHRRENHGEGIATICNALKTLVATEEVQIIFPIHHHPKVKHPVLAALSETENIFLVDQIDYRAFVYLLLSCHFIITDSGGIQEEAPSLGKPVLVTRYSTERQEAITAGSSILVGPDHNAIHANASKLLHDPVFYKEKSKTSNPFGDGKACDRIIAAILQMDCTR